MITVMAFQEVHLPSPLAAISVAKSTAALFRTNSLQTSILLICCCRPWRARMEIPGRSRQNTLNRYCTWHKQKGKVQAHRLQGFLKKCNLELRSCINIFAYIFSKRILIKKIKSQLLKIKIEKSSYIFKSTKFFPIFEWL